MRTVFYITPWHGQTAHLIPEYAKATEGGTVITIDNGTPPETAQALQRQFPNFYLRNEQNSGFGPANNQGLSYVFSRLWMHVIDEYDRGEISLDELEGNDDIICFINSDVRASGLAEALRGNVQHGALYGPSLAAQLVLGRWMHYLEGWCIAATLKTWLTLGAEQPWPEEYAPAYWEDNALSLRALRHGISLVHLQLPVQHIGGQSGGIAQAGEILEANRARFVGEVREMLQDHKPPTNAMHGRYQQLLRTQTDIQHHLPLLNALAHGTVVELGTRSGVSTAAFLDGVERRGGNVVSIDIADTSALYRGHPQWTCIQADSRNPDLPDMVLRSIGLDAGPYIDVLLIDTEHTYDQVMDELDVWVRHMKPGGYILAHDTETFPGVRQAIDDWLDYPAPHGTTVTYVLPNNGMAVIRIGDYHAESV